MNCAISHWVAVIASIKYRWFDMFPYTFQSKVVLDGILTIFFSCLDVLKSFLMWTFGYLPPLKLSVPFNGPLCLSIFNKIYYVPVLSGNYKFKSLKVGPTCFCFLLALKSAIADNICLGSFPKKDCLCSWCLPIPILPPFEGKNSAIWRRKSTTAILASNSISLHSPIEFVLIYEIFIKTSVYVLNCNECCHCIHSLHEWWKLWTWIIIIILPLYGTHIKKGTISCKLG